MRSAEWTEKSINETFICVLFLVVGLASLLFQTKDNMRDKILSNVENSLLDIYRVPCPQYWNYWRAHISEYPLPLSARGSRFCFLIKEVVSHWSWSHRERHAATCAAESLWWLWGYWEGRVTSSSDQVDQVDHFHLVFLQDHDVQKFLRDTLENPSNTT